MNIKCVKKKDGDYLTEFELYFDGKRMKGHDSTAQLLFTMIIGLDHGDTKELEFELKQIIK
jgi:hypothetical protein